MEASPPTWKLFEDLVRRILVAHRFQVTIHSPRGDSGFDLLGNLANELWAIEVKYYRTARAQPTLIEAAAIRVVNNGVSTNAMKGMLVVSCILPVQLRDALEQRFRITFVDRVDLQMLAARFPSLAEELDALIEIDPSEAPTARNVREDFWERIKPLAKDASLPQDMRGTELCHELKGVKEGKAHWSKHEAICKKILEYLFRNDLQGWHAQKRTDDGLNRFDFVCRVRPVTEFWKFVIDHLNSRYVLFEFKNYSGKIKQGQILTTEKYLLERGLRRMAIILTRKGAEPQAIAMAQGAMRESGKLMLIVNDDLICKMLHMKQGGDDPTDCLFELADNFLMSLPR